MRKNRAAGLFEAESRYDFNECFAADLLQMQPTVIMRSTFGCRTNSGVEHYGGSLLTCINAQNVCSRTKTAHQIELPKRFLIQ